MRQGHPMDLTAVQCRDPQVLGRKIRRDARVRDRFIDAPSPVVLHGAVRHSVCPRVIVESGAFLEHQAFDAPPTEFSSERQSYRPPADDDDWIRRLQRLVTSNHDGVTTG